MNETQTDMLSSKRDLLKQIVGAGMKPAHEERGHQHAAVRLNCQDFSTYQEVKVLDEQKSIFKKYKVENPYFRVNESVTRDETVIGNKSYVSFSSYNYLGLSGTEAISKAAKQAIDIYGTSPSASRLVSGEKTIHVQLEKKVASFLGAEDALVFPNGHATNVTVIGNFFNSQDLIIYDELSHNSVIEGARLSGARRVSFPHSDYQTCEKIIKENINDYQKIVVIIEGVYSMDGDIAPLDKFVEIRQRHNILLYVDEAHSLGCIGRSGRGVCEYFNIPASNIDFLMGTLSKSLASHGGYIAGKSVLIDYLKYTTPGFVYTAGITPSNAAAAIAAIEMIEMDSSLLTALSENAAYFIQLAQKAGLNTGLSHDSPVVPIIVGEDFKAIKLADDLYKNGVCVHPIISPTVPRGEARLRFFITSAHTKEQLESVVALLSKYIV